MERTIQEIYCDRSQAPIRVPSCTLLLLNADGKVLLLKNSVDGQWQLPLTDIRPKETATETTQRLARGQTGVELEDIECIGYSSADQANYLEHDDLAIQLHCFIMVSTQWQGSVTGAEAIHDAQFFGMQTLPPVAEHTRQAIQLFKKWLPRRDFQFA